MYGTYIAGGWDGDARLVLSRDSLLWKHSPHICDSSSFFSADGGRKQRESWSSRSELGSIGTPYGNHRFRAYGAIQDFPATKFRPPKFRPLVSYLAL